MEGYAMVSAVHLSPFDEALVHGSYHAFDGAACHFRVWWRGRSSVDGSQLAQYSGMRNMATNVTARGQRHDRVTTDGAMPAPAPLDGLVSPMDWKADTAKAQALLECSHAMYVKKLTPVVA